MGWWMGIAQSSQSDHNFFLMRDEFIFFGHNHWMQMQRAHKLQFVSVRTVESLSNGS